MDANRLDGVYVVSPALEVMADATGSAGVKADLLRVDADRVRAALDGRVTTARAYDVGDLAVETTYFPVRARDGSVPAVLALEAGAAFTAARTGLRRALAIGVLLACLGAIALGVVAARYAAAERHGREAAARAARGEAMSRMAAVAAHEIRNPLGIIRTAVELVRERAGTALEARSRARVGAGNVQVTVRDDGKGVPAERRERLFEAFATGRAGGTGLGLAVSRRLVEQHGGSLVLVPAEGPGATFLITLPLER